MKRPTISIVRKTHLTIIYVNQRLQDSAQLVGGRYRTRRVSNHGLGTGTACTRGVNPRGVHRGLLYRSPPRPWGYSIWQRIPWSHVRSWGYPIGHSIPTPIPCPHARSRGSTGGHSVPTPITWTHAWSWRSTGGHAITTPIPRLPTRSWRFFCGQPIPAPLPWLHTSSLVLAWVCVIVVMLSPENRLLLGVAHQRGSLLKAFVSGVVVRSHARWLARLFRPWGGTRGQLTGRGGHGR